MIKSSRIESLDILRAIAIILVVLLHANSAVSNLPAILTEFFSIGWIGVDLFFLLSGFLIGKQIFNKTGSNSKFLEIWNFWIKRWTRTLPLYLLILAFYALVKPFLGFPFVDGHWGFLVFLQNYMTLNDFVQSWSLCIEEQFYFILPLLVIPFSLQSKKSAIWLFPIFLSTGLRLYNYKNGLYDFETDAAVDYLMRFKTHLHLDGLSLGLFLARTEKKWPESLINFKFRFIFWIPIFLAPWLATYKLKGIYSVFTFTILAIFFSLILVSHYRLKIPPSLRFIIEKTALYSYGIYLWNHLVIRILEKLDLNIHWTLQFLLFMASSYIVATFTYYIVEKPGLKLRKHLIKE